jgi:magnesium chelatase family protein
VLARTVTHALVGLDARRVEVEANVESGIPGFTIVGLADRACQEAKHRVRSSVAAAELEWPRHRITVNLAPAGLRKEGSGFDLPIALAVLAASRQIPPERLRGHAAVGELALDGRVRPVGGVLAAAEGALKGGLERLLCAAIQPPRRLRIDPVRSVLAGRRRTCAGRVTASFEPSGGNLPLIVRIADVRGRERVAERSRSPLRGAQPLLAGRPGPEAVPPAVGVLPALLPTGAGSRGSIRWPAYCRPVSRSSRQRRSARTQCVGRCRLRRRRPRGGQAAHRGVLLLDEMPGSSGPPSALRQPLGDGIVNIAAPGAWRCSAASSSSPPLVCPCGAAATPSRMPCSAQRLAAFRDKLSRALLDRFDLVVTVPGHGRESLRHPQNLVVWRAWHRLGRHSACRRRVGCEADELHPRGRATALSGRAGRVARVAQTIAALGGSVGVLPEHVAEASHQRRELDA